MSDLSSSEKRKLEKQFSMSSGYVLNFSDRTMAEFVEDSVHRDIDDVKYHSYGSSKAKRLRAFWAQEPNHLVGMLISDLLDYTWQEGFADNQLLFDECKHVAARLVQGVAVEAIDAITPEGNEPGFEVLARAVHDSIEKNEPQGGLDRLHTYVTKLIRTLADRRGIIVDRDKALHSIFGEYVKALRSAGLIESEMTGRILKASISILEAFNDVRNNNSLAHDNPTLNYEESLLIFQHVCASVRFIRGLDKEGAVEIEKRF